MSDYFDEDTGEVRQQLPTVAESQMQSLISASPECGEVFGALCDMQGEMDAPKRTKFAKVKGRTKGGQEYEYSYDYAPLDEIIKTIKKPMAAAGLAYRQFLAHRGNQSVVRTVIAHKSGQWMLTDYPIFWDESRGMQGFASGVTYARRYGLMLALGVAAEDDDDANVADGNVATTQDRRQTASRGRTATKETPATPAPPAPSPPPQRAGNGVAAPPADLDQLKAHSRAGLDEMEGLIEACDSEGEVHELRESERWKSLHMLVERASSVERAVNIMARLGDVADKRIAALHQEGIAHA
jgi:hypothetical protein